MARIPKPEGYTGSGPDASILRTFDGHRAVNLETEPDLAGDINWRSNTRHGDNADIGTEDYGRPIGPSQYDS